MAIRFAPSSGSSPFEFNDGYADGYRDFGDEEGPSSPLPAKIQLGLVGAQIVGGIYPDRFRWKFLLDLVLLGLTLDVALFWLIAAPLFTAAMAGIAALSATVFGIKHLAKALGYRVERLNHPDNMVRALRNTGGVIFTSLGPLVACDLGLLPVKALRTLSGESAEHRADDKFEPLRQYIRDILECWNLPVSVDETKYEQGGQHNNEENQERPHGRG